jgi:hypothetical protein|tara:strand:- start:910 stop:1659 length:750 start_codon:yes stop_codon:yes gene_type:complete
MQRLTKYLTDGLKNTVLFKNNSGTSHNGPWKQVYTDTLLDRFYVGEMSSVEYTISSDLDTTHKEIIKVLVTATDDVASIVVYARNHTVRELIAVSATVNKSYVEVVVSPAVTPVVTPTYVVTVVSTSQGNKYFIDGLRQDTLNLVEGSTYKFDQSDSSNSNHPLRFSVTPHGIHESGTEYTTGVTVVGTAGTAGAYTEIVVAANTPTLHYYCVYHNGMGGQANTPITGNDGVKVIYTAQYFHCQNTLTR